MEWTKENTLSITRYLRLISLSLFFFGASIDAQELVGKGATDCIWGSPSCNRCVHNIKSQFKSINFEPTGRFTYWSGAGRVMKFLEKPMLPLSEEKLEEGDRNKGHIQGFGRIPGLAANDWFVYSVDTNDRDDQLAGLVFAQMSAITRNVASAANGGVLSRRDAPDLLWVPQPAIDQSGKVFHAISPLNETLTTKHPGGFQLIGQIVVVPSFGERTAFVSFIQGFETADDLLGLRVINDFYLPSARETWFHWHMSNRKAFALAITKLTNGRYLMMVNRSDFGHMQYFVSTETELAEANDWIETNVDDTALPKYQNLSLMNECGTQQIYLAAILQKPAWEGLNRADLYRVDLKGDNYNTSTRIAEVVIDEASDACESKGGSSFYVTPSGRLILYCSQGRSVEGNRSGQNPLLLSFSKFVADDDLPCNAEDGQSAIDHCMILDNELELKRLHD